MNHDREGMNLYGNKLSDFNFLHIIVFAMSNIAMDVEGDGGECHHRS